jgi:hypothetical protein
MNKSVKYRHDIYLKFSTVKRREAVEQDDGVRAREASIAISYFEDRAFKQKQ